MSEHLASYVPRLHAEWAAAGTGRDHRLIDGSWLFADVSGFTALAERLTKLGTAGSELLGELVNRVMDPYVQAVEEHGGEVLKFGGDAMLVLFEGPGHEARAAVTAVAMQRTMRAFRRVRTPAGAVTLRVSIGIHAGVGLLVLAGAEHLDLVVTGPAITGCLERESAASAGEVLMSPTVARALAAHHAGEPRPPHGVLLAGAPRAPVRPAARAREQLPPGGERALPRHLREHEPGEVELRPVAIAFVQFKGAGAVLERDGPDTLAAAIDRLVTVAQRAADTHRVTILDSDVDKNGGKLFLAAGAPVAASDDADRLLLTLREIVACELPLDVRAGANWGRVATGDLGSPRCRTYTTLGDATNLAARIMGKSQPGRVLASRALLDQARVHWSTEAVAPFAVKGKSAPVDAAWVGVPRGARRRSSRRLVGRGAELRTLNTVLDAARDGRGGIVELVGEPGIGKTRLLDELLAQTGTLPVWRVEAGAFAGVAAFRVLRGPLRQLLGVTSAEVDELRAAFDAYHTGLAPVQAALLAGALGIEDPALAAATAQVPVDLRADALRGVVGQLLDERLGSAAAIIVIDDAHWIDRDSAAVLLPLLVAAPARGRVVAVTRRPVDGGLEFGDAPRELLEVRPIADEAAREYLREHAGSLSPATERAIVSRARGNPLFLEELLRAAAADTPLDVLPDSVEALLAARIDRLPTLPRRLLRRAAVLGVESDIDLLAVLLETGTADLDTALDAAGDLVERDGGRMRFRNPLVREAAYATLSHRRRRELHRRAVELLEQRGAGEGAHVDLLVAHCAVAGLHDRTWRYGRLAGERARASGALVEAMVHLEAALAASRSLPDVDDAARADVAEALAEAAGYTGDFARAAEAIRFARARRREPVRRAALARKAGWLRERYATYGDALRWYARGLNELGDDSGTAAVAERARLRFARGVARMRQGRAAQAGRDLEAAIADATASGDIETLASAHDTLAWRLLDVAREDARHHQRSALALFEQLGDERGLGRAHNHLGYEAYLEGAWDTALDHYERAHKHFENAGDLVYAAAALNNLAEILSDRGELELARQYFRDALTAWRGCAYPVGIGIALSNLGRATTRAGDAEAARALLDEARTQLRAIGNEPLALEADVREAERRLAAGEEEGAVEIAGAVASAAADAGDMPHLLAIAERVAGAALLRRGDVTEGRARLQQSLRCAREAEAPYEEYMTLAIMGTYDDAFAAQMRAIAAQLGISPTSDGPAAPPEAQPALPARAASEATLNVQ